MNGAVKRGALDAPDALARLVRAIDANTGAEPSASVYEQALDEARAALTAQPAAAVVPPGVLHLLQEFVECREEARCIDDCIPQASERAWKALAARMDNLERAARAALAASPPEAPQPTESRDWCTDPDNCQRCKAPTWDQKNHHHAGIPFAAQAPQPAPLREFPSRSAAATPPAPESAQAVAWIADCPYCLRTVHFAKPEPVAYAPWSKPMGVDWSRDANGRPLAAPPATQEAPAMSPLSEEKIGAAIRLLTDFAGNDFRDAVRLCRAIEAEHGIAAAATVGRER